MRSKTDLGGNATASEKLDAQDALLARPRFSIRTRIAGVFVLLFMLMCGITAAEVLFLSDLRVRMQFLERIQVYTFEIQQARRFEKNFFLYGTDLADALANIHTAHSHLDRGADDIRKVVGDKKYREIRESLTKYERLIDGLLRTSGGSKPHARATERHIEARLRKHGARILVDAEEMIDQERFAMHSALNTSILVSIGFLVIMFFIMVFIAGFIIRAVLRPLSRFQIYTSRIGSGDYSPIKPLRKYRDEFSDLSIAINKMLRELKLRQDQLLQSGKMAAVGTLTSGIAHELNNPLNNIGLTTEALVDGFSDISDQDKLSMLKQIYTQVERASSTVGNLLDFTRKAQPEFASISIANAVEATLRLVDNEIRLGGIDLHVDLDADLPEISGDPRSLQQAFVNLFLNAVQAMPDGGRLEVTGRVEGGFVRVNVRDTGIGIPPENLEKIFDPFFTSKEPGQGTGLGLSVSYGIIEKHQGKISVQSEVGEGSTFSIFLPVKAKD